MGANDRIDYLEPLNLEDLRNSLCCCCDTSIRFQGVFAIAVREPSAPVNRPRDHWEIRRYNNGLLVVTREGDNGNWNYSVSLQGAEGDTNGNGATSLDKFVTRNEWHGPVKIGDPVTCGDWSGQEGEVKLLEDIEFLRDNRFIYTGLVGEGSREARFYELE